MSDNKVKGAVQIRVRSEVLWTGSCLVLDMAKYGHADDGVDEGDER